jgi:hypothetical protein
MIPMEGDLAVGIEQWNRMACKMEQWLHEMADGYPHYLPPEILAEANKFLSFAVQIARERAHGWKPHFFQPGDAIIFESVVHGMCLSYIGRTGRDADDFDRDLINLVDFVGCLGRIRTSQERPLKKSALWAADFFAALAASSYCGD